MTIHIRIERDLQSRSSKDGARFRVRCYAQPGGPCLLASNRQISSVTQAKAEAETLFGQLDWRTPPTNAEQQLRLVATFEFD